MRFEALRERLLRAGVAPRHVRRYLAELEDHYDDALRAELARGTALLEAREAASARLGTEETLAQSMLERRELRSKAARFPALFFGAAPVMAWLGTPIVILAAVSLLPQESRRMKIDASFIDACVALGFVYTRLLPVLLGAVALHMAAARRSRALWPLVGAGAVDVLAGTLSVYTFPGQLGVTSWLLPWLVPFTDLLGPRDGKALGEGLLRAALLLGLSLIAHQLTRRLGGDRSALTAG
jgi:hypothetical protein